MYNIRYDGYEINVDQILYAMKKKIRMKQKRYSMHFSTQYNQGVVRIVLV